MSSTIKNILILVVVVGALVLGYIFFIKKAPTDEPLTSSTTDSPIAGDTSAQGANSMTSEISKDFITVLLSVKSIKLEDGILTDQAFLSLKDSTITLVQVGDEGRVNPFAPIGSEAVTTTTTPDSGLNKVPPAGDSENTSGGNGLPPGPGAN